MNKSKQTQITVKEQEIRQIMLGLQVLAELNKGALCNMRQRLGEQAYHEFEYNFLKNQTIEIEELYERLSQK